MFLPFIVKIYYYINRRYGDISIMKLNPIGYVNNILIGINIILNYLTVSYFSKTNDTLFPYIIYIQVEDIYNYLHI